MRFLAVLVVATPCPLLIAIPVAIIGAISLAAKRGIIIRDPAVLERIDRCRTIVLDKTGTLTYGEPTLTERLVPPMADGASPLQLAASLERYSKHPLAAAVVRRGWRANTCRCSTRARSARSPGHGLEGIVAGRHVRIVGRRQAEALGLAALLPPPASGLECVVIVDWRTRRPSASTTRRAKTAARSSTTSGRATR